MKLNVLRGWKWTVSRNGSKLLSQKTVHYHSSFFDGPPNFAWPCTLRTIHFRPDSKFLQENLKRAQRFLGWCDKNVYRSWNKCAVSGKCYTTCSDGNCYEEVKNSSEEIKVTVINSFTSRWNLKLFDKYLMRLTPMLKLAFQTSFFFLGENQNQFLGPERL